MEDSNLNLNSLICIEVQRSQNNRQIEQERLKAIAIESRGQISHFFNPVKIRRGWATCLGKFFRFSL